MRFEREETDPYEEKRLRDESLDELADEDRALERLDRHGPASMSLEQATEIACRTGNTEHIDAHWQRTRTAVIHDGIRDFLDDPPRGVGPVARVRLGDALRSLRADLDRMGDGT